jgi:hypothetical protein
LRTWIVQSREAHYSTQKSDSRNWPAWPQNPSWTRIYVKEQQKQGRPHKEEEDVRMHTVK